MAAFDRLDRLVSRAVDRLNAIPFTLKPQYSTPNGRPGDDPARPRMEIKGIFDFITVEYGVQLGVRRSYREANDLRALQVGADPQLSIDVLYFKGAELPRQGDMIEFTENPELPEFQVISAQPDGLSRIVLKMGKIGESEEGEE